MAHEFSAGPPTADRNPDQQMGGLSRKTKNRTGGPVWETGGGGACHPGAQQFQKKFAKFFSVTSRAGGSPDRRRRAGGNRQGDQPGRQFTAGAAARAGVGVRAGRADEAPSSHCTTGRSVLTRLQLRFIAAAGSLLVTDRLWPGVRFHVVAPKRPLQNSRDR